MNIYYPYYIIRRVTFYQAYFTKFVEVNMNIILYYYYINTLFTSTNRIDKKKIKIENP